MPSQQTTTISDWIDRRRDAMEDASHMTTHMLLTAGNPFETLAIQFRFASLAYERMAKDVLAAQDLSREMLGSLQSESAASRSAAATRAAGKPLAEAREASN